MTETLTLQCEKREGSGKGPARAMRRDGWIPAIVYGGSEPPLKVALFQRQIKRELEMNPRFFSSIVELDIKGGKERVLPREAQLHPVSDMPLHLDFIRVAQGATVTVEVPVHFLNEETCPGLKRGGVLNIVRREIELVCPIENIPGQIEVDLAGIEIGDSVHISQVSLPADVTPTITDRDFTICAVVGRGPQEEEETEDEAAEVEPGEVPRAGEEEEDEED
ncbi:MAG: 50S ribosomal protein L25/general stress protein Ctc [Geminicoccaceae bacterium]|nr:50S ribosomal protein L25/general stress protein Ctc [Geminicoccaceae bacterium]